MPDRHSEGLQFSGRPFKASAVRLQWVRIHVALAAHTMWGSIFLRIEFFACKGTDCYILQFILLDYLGVDVMFLVVYDHVYLLGSLFDFLLFLILFTSHAT